MTPGLFVFSYYFLNNRHRRCADVARVFRRKIIGVALATPSSACVICNIEKNLSDEYNLGVARATLRHSVYLIIAGTYFSERRTLL